MNPAEEIMRTITSQLTGEQEKDLNFLKSQYDFFRDKDGAEPILRILSELICTYTPFQSEEKIKNALNNNELTFEKALKVVESDFQSQKMLDAEIILKTLLTEYEKRKLYKNESDIEYKSFNNLFEEIIYKKVNKPKRIVVKVEENFSTAYFLYSTLLIIKKDYKKAMQMIKKSISWNPVNTNAFLNCCEVFKITEQNDKNIDMAKAALKTVYSRVELSSCYKNLAFSYIGKNLDTAAILYGLSIKIFPQNQRAIEEFEMLKKKSNKNFILPDNKDIREILEKENIQFGLNPEIIKTANEYKEFSINVHNDELSKYFTTILNSLEEIQKIFD